jgi:uncharacterized protein YfaQ (DUF2300 family)
LIKTVGEDVAEHLATPPKPKRKQYPSDKKTPAVATRLPRENYDELKALAKEVNRPLALVVKVILLDWLEKNRADGKGQIKRLVTSK